MSPLFSSIYTVKLFSASWLPAEASFYVSSHTVLFEGSAFMDSSGTQHAFSLRDRFRPFSTQTPTSPAVALKPFQHRNHLGNHTKMLTPGFTFLNQLAQWFNCRWPSPPTLTNLLYFSLSCLPNRSSPYWFLPQTLE